MNPPTLIEDPPEVVSEYIHQHAHHHHNRRQSSVLPIGIQTTLRRRTIVSSGRHLRCAAYPSPPPPKAARGPRPPTDPRTLHAPAVSYPVSIAYSRPVSRHQRVHARQL